MKNLLLKIQGLPESKRKIILWLVTAILALTLLTFYIKNVLKRVKDIEDIGVDEIKKELQLPLLEEEFKKMPKIEIPEIKISEIDQEGLRELEQIIKEGQIYQKSRE